MNPQLHRALTSNEVLDLVERLGKLRTVGRGMLASPPSQADIAGALEHPTCLLICAEPEFRSAWSTLRRRKRSAENSEDKLRLVEIFLFSAYRYLHALHTGWQPPGADAETRRRAVKSTQDLLSAMDQGVALRRALDTWQLRDLLGKLNLELSFGRSRPYRDKHALSRFMLRDFSRSLDVSLSLRSVSIAQQFAQLMGIELDESSIKRAVREASRQSKLESLARALENHQPLGHAKGSEIT